MLYACIIVAFTVLLVTIVFQTIYVWIYVRTLNRVAIQDFGIDSPSSEKNSPTFQNKIPSHPIAVILCLRGGDPSLMDCLNSISKQDYNEFQLHCVFDHPNDPAIDVVNRFADGSPEFGQRMTQHVLNQVSKKGSLKCQALTQVIKELAPEIEIVALIDADSVVDPNWLSDLTSPFDTDDQIAAVSGNRWFEPETSTVGNFLRQIWNAAAIVQMLIYNIPWGGSMALRRSAIESTGLVDIWSQSFCEDTALPAHFAKHRLKVIRVPNVIVCNRESTTLAGAREWIRRQLLTARLYHRAWPLVFGHAVAVGCSLIGILVAILATLFTGHWTWFISLVSVLLILQLINERLVNAIAQSNRRVLAKHAKNKPNTNMATAVGIPDTVVSSKRESTSDQKSASNPAAYFTALLASQIVHPLAIVSAALAKQVRWRGIEYQIKRDRTVTLEKYHPYRETNDQRLEDSIH